MSEGTASGAETLETSCGIAGGRVLGGGDAKLPLPWPLKLVRRFPGPRRVPARLIGMGFRPEHVRTPDVLGTH